MQWHSEESERAEISVKALLDNPAVTPPTRLFFSSRLCARRSSCHWRLCPRAAFSETILFEDYAAALGHLVSDRMRVWKKNTYKERSVFFSLLSVDRRIPQRQKSRLLSALCVLERPRTSCGLFLGHHTETMSWGTELWVSPGALVTFALALSLSPCACV